MRSTLRKLNWFFVEVGYKDSIATVKCNFKLYFSIYTVLWQSWFYRNFALQTKNPIGVIYLTFRMSAPYTKNKTACWTILAWPLLYSIGFGRFGAKDSLGDIGSLCIHLSLKTLHLSTPTLSQFSDESILLFCP